MSSSRQPRRGGGPSGSDDEEQSQYAYAKYPHGIGSDRRLSGIEKQTISALLYWCLSPQDRCTVSKRRLADYVGVSEDTIARALDRLEELGYIRREAAPYSRENMTGRVIILAWIQDPSILPAPPSRKGALPAPTKGRRRRAKEGVNRPDEAEVTSGEVPQACGTINDNSCGTLVPQPCGTKVAQPCGTLVPQPCGTKDKKKTRKEKNEQQQTPPAAGCRRAGELSSEGGGSQAIVEEMAELFPTVARPKLAAVTRAAGAARMRGVLESVIRRIKKPKPEDGPRVGWRFVIACLEDLPEAAGGGDLESITKAELAEREGAGGKGSGLAGRSPWNGVKFQRWLLVHGPGTVARFGLLPPEGKLAIWQSWKRDDPAKYQTLYDVLGLSRRPPDPPAATNLSA